LLNNRQAGRRRGRGNQRPQGNNNGGRGAEQGNRIDNRARGNAPQMLEKYNMLARDAQQQGDRVMAEYYLQFADHYFRVVADSRARYEENRPRQTENGREDNGRDEWQNEDVVATEGEEAEDQIEASEDSDQANERQYQQNRQRDRQQPRRNDYRRDERDAAPREPREADPQPQLPIEAEEQPAPRPRRARPPRAEAESNGFDVSILPPAISSVEPEEKPAPKPRGRKPKLVAVDATVEG
jgi:hypothetical protein